MRAEPGPVAELSQNAFPHRVMLVAGSEFGRIVFARIPRIRIANVRHDDHVAGHGLAQYPLNLRRIQSQSRAVNRLRRLVKFDNPAAEIVKRFQPPQPIIDDVRLIRIGHFLPIRHDDEAKPVRIAPSQTDGLFERRHGHERIDAIMIGRFKPRLGMSRGKEMAMGVDDNPLHRRPRQRLAVIQVEAIVFFELFGHERLCTV